MPRSQSRTFWVCEQWWKCMWKKRHYRWREVGLWLWCWNKKPLLNMGLKNFSKNRRTMASSVKCEGDIDCVICLFMEMFFTTNFQLMAIMSTNSIISKWLNARKRPWKEKAQLQEGRKWMLHHKRLPNIHSPLITRDFLVKHNTHVPQPPYSPHLAQKTF